MEVYFPKFIFLSIVTFLWESTWSYSQFSSSSDAHVPGSAPAAFQKQSHSTAFPSGLASPVVLFNPCSRITVLEVHLHKLRMASGVKSLPLSAPADYLLKANFGLMQLTASRERHAIPTCCNKVRKGSSPHEAGPKEPYLKKKWERNSDVTDRQLWSKSRRPDTSWLQVKRKRVSPGASHLHGVWMSKDECPPMEMPRGLPPL